jgi:hypothetical protein
MNIFKENTDELHFGMHRAKIISLDNTIKNGIYKVRVWPFMVDILDNDLPLAQSNMTVNDKHINLKVGDWVWVFFENGNPEYPVIFDKCNIKDKFPDGTDGNSPTWFNNIQANNQINESTVNYNGQYNTVSGFDFGEIHIQFDEQNKQLIIMVGSKYFILDSNGDIHEKVNNKFVTVTQKLNMIAQSFKLLTTMADEISISETGKVTIKGGTNPMLIKNSLTSLKALIEDVLIGLSTQVQTGNLGLPIAWNSNPKLVTGLIKLNQLLTEL